jgi:eukaryotic-like serine/threonine-protein kinase
MQGERWRQVDKIFHDLIDQTPGQRASFLEQVCANDPSLKKEVEQLIEAYERSGSFLDSPASASISGSLVGRTMGSFHVKALIGSGGMGEVYRAWDSKLKRDVAIKILPQEFSRDTDRVARFQREAEVLASLNHPNIAGIYDLEEANGSRYLVMELVEGETLADRIARWPIPVEESLLIAKQICDALQSAHEKGIIHRDLKPANIKLAPGGKVKVLDFGLAKALTDVAGSTTVSNSPTLVSSSMGGVILGTAAYMSPEQARGIPVDKQADIWAFGVVLYEMLTGRRLFKGDTQLDTLAAVLRAEPEWKQIPTRIRPLLRLCLERDPKRRLHDFADARILLDDVSEDAVSGTAPATSRVSAKLAWVVAAIAIVALALAYVYLRRQPSPPAQAVRFEIWPPDNESLSDAFSVSPDGRKLAFIATSDRPRLWIRSLETLDAQPLPGTEDVNGALLWSPDGRFVGYSVGGKLRKIETSGGFSQQISDVPGTLTSGFWGPEGKIVFTVNSRPGIFLLRDAGDLTMVASVGNNPTLLPDGRHFVYSRTDLRAPPVGIYLGSLEDKPEQPNAKKLLPVVSPCIFVPEPSASSSNGYLLFLRSATLMSQPFDLRRLEISGQPTPIAERIRSNVVAGFAGVNNFAAFSSSPSGVLVYRSDRPGVPVPTVGQASQFTWFDRQGKVLGTVGDPDAYFQMAISPDGKRLAATQLASPNPPAYDIWMFELTGGMRSTRFTTDPASETWPTWSPEEGRVAFASNRSGRFNLYQKATSGAGSEELLYQSPETQRPTSWSSNGRFILIWSSGEATKTAGDVWVLDMGDPASATHERKAFPLVRTGAEEWDAQFSPDMRWIAYTSNESRRNEVYVRPFDPSMATGAPPPQSPWPVSKGGGRGARWRGDSKELFYMGPGNTVMSVTVGVSGAAANPVFVPGTPRALFKAHPVSLFWDVAPDGQKFLIPVPVADGSTIPYKVVLNWTATLKR